VLEEESNRDQDDAQDQQESAREDVPEPGVDGDLIAVYVL